MYVNASIYLNATIIHLSTYIFQNTKNSYTKHRKRRITTSILKATTTKLYFRFRKSISNDDRMKKYEYKLSLNCFVMNINIPLLFNSVQHHQQQQRRIFDFFFSFLSRFYSKINLLRLNMFFNSKSKYDMSRANLKRNEYNINMHRNDDDKLVVRSCWSLLQF